MGNLQATPSANACETSVTRSKQSVKGENLLLKIEFTIEKFASLMDRYVPYDSLWSQGATFKQLPRAIWKLQVYPNGSQMQGSCSFFLYLTGPMEEAGESIDPFIRLYLVNGSNMEKTVLLNRCKQQFPSSGTYGWGRASFAHDKVKPALRADGTLLLVAEVEMDKSSLTILGADLTTDGGALKMKQLSLYGDLFKKEMHTDCSLRVGKETFRVHKGILSVSSPIFAAMFNDERKYKEADEGVLIKDFEPQPVQAMLEFLYNGEIDWVANKDWQADVLRLADKYELLELKAHLEHRLAAAIATPAQLVEMAVLAYQHNFLVLKKACANHLHTYRSSIVASPEWKELKAASPELALELLEMQE